MRLKMRSAATIVTVITMVTMALAWCGVTASASTNVVNSTATQRWVVGVSNGYFGNTARIEFQAVLKAYAATPSVSPHIKKLIINNAGTSVATQIAAVDTMIAEHVNLLILDSNSLTGLNSTIARAHNAGILVVTANDLVTSPLVYSIETENAVFGQIMAKAFVARLHGHGNIVVLRGIAGNAVDAAEAQGFDSVFKANPGIHVLATVYPEWDDAMAQTDMAALLSRYNDINGVFTEGGMEQGVVRAYVAAHRNFVPVSGTDENGFACQIKQYHSQGLQGPQVTDGIYMYALALKVGLGVLAGVKEPRFTPVAWAPLSTAQSIKDCNPKLSPGLFLTVADPSQGINVTDAEVNKYL
jgi:ribose transport system substrate-binding protein